MPNRILREEILSNPRIARLGWAEEVFYRRLMSVVDDFGRYYADHGMLRAACYPRQLNKVSDSDTGKWLRACVDAALVRVYPAKDGERYLEMLEFGQQARAKHSKFPNPLDACVHSHANDFVREQTRTDAPVFGDGDVSVCEDEGGERAKRSPSGSRIPPNFPTEDEVAWCKAERPDLDATALTAKFRDYWLGVPGTKGRKADWPATWRNFVRSEWNRSPPARTASTPSRQDRISAAVAELTGRSRPQPETIDVVAVERAS